MKSFLYSVWETIEVGVIAVVAVFIIRGFLVQPFLVSGASMEPNFSSGDYLLIDELSFRFREPGRGEVIVFRYPGDHRTFYIKRIIGLPGEKIGFTDGKIKIFSESNPAGFVLPEKYLLSGAITGGSEIALRDDEYFVLGDNRNYSFDSRSWGSLKKEEVIGVVRLRLWPFNKVLAVEKPNY